MIDHLEFKRMKYRAILITNEKLLRPLQSFSNEPGRLRNWAAVVLKSHVGVVKIYETIETEVETISQNNRPQD